MVKPIAHEIKIGRKVVLLPPYISREGVMIAPEKALEDTLEGMLSIKTEEGCDPLARKTTCLRWRDAEKISGFRKAYFSMADSVIAGADVNRIDPMYLCRKLDAGAVFLLLVTDEESVFSYDRPGSPPKTTHWENEAIIENIPYGTLHPGGLQGCPGRLRFRNGKTQGSLPGQRQRICVSRCGVDRRESHHRSFSRRPGCRIALRLRRTRFPGAGSFKTVNDAFPKPETYSFTKPKESLLQIRRGNSSPE